MTHGATRTPGRPTRLHSRNAFVPSFIFKRRHTLLSTKKPTITIFSAEFQPRLCCNPSTFITTHQCDTAEPFFQVLLLKNQGNRRITKWLDSTHLMGRAGGRREWRSEWTQGRGRAERKRETKERRGTLYKKSVPSSNKCTSFHNRSRKSAGLTGRTDGVMPHSLFDQNPQCRHVLQPRKRQVARLDTQHSRCPRNCR